MRTHLIKLFTEDDRAVAPIIGFILLFAMLTIAFAGYQAEQVPQQNAETEFQHYQDVQNDLRVVRNAISRAGQQNQSQFESVRLGTNYRERILALNPPDPAGTLRTSDPYDVTIEQGGTQIAASPIPTRFLTYQDGYNEQEVAPIRYDNSVLYLSDPDGDEAVVFEEQNLVRDNGDIVLTALQKPFDRSATGRVSIELYPTTSAPTTLPDGTLTITIPTRLSADYWTGALAETTLDEDNYEVLDATKAYSGAPDVRGIELQVTADDLVFNTVGIGSVPEGSNSPTTGIENGGGGGGSGGSGGTTPRFSSVDASDLPKSDSPDSQTLSFTPSDASLASGVSVNINLDDAQNTDKNGPKIDYQPASINSVDGSPNKGNAEFISQDTDTAIIEYTTTQEIPIGEQIQLQVSDIEYDNGNLKSSTVVFTRSDGGSMSTTFSDD